MSRARALVVLGLVAAVGCGERATETTPSRIDPATPAASASVAPRPALDVMAQLARCTVAHRGLLLDLGSPAVDGLEGFALGTDPGIATVEREGATWARFQTKSATYRFQLDDPQPVFVSARVRGVASRSAQVTIDGKPVGTLSFGRGQIRIVTTQAQAIGLAAGAHTIGLRFVGGGRGSTEPYAEVDWLRIGLADDDPSTFAAPTLRDVTQSVALGGVPHQALAVRSPSTVRCPLGVPKDAHLKVAVGLLGTGEADASIRVLTDADAPVTLKTVRVLGGDRAAWTDLDVSLSAFADRPATVELGTETGTRGTRVLFGDPVVVTPGTAAAKVPHARAVIIVVLAGLDPARLPPFAPDKPLPLFDVLAREGAVFTRHRSPTSIAAGVMASLLTGLTPRTHTVEDAYARLPDSLPTLATLARDASVRTAMFTAHPATFDAFGFARGWDRFEAHSPVSPALAGAPLDDLATFIAEQGKVPGTRLLGVAHARGVHPPYDISPAELTQLEPKDYSGPMDPRRAGQVLERMRTKKGAAKLTDADRQRLAAMTDVALAQSDRALSNLIDALRKAALWDDTLLFVTSDVAAETDPTATPFAETQDVTEEALHVPLYVHFPGGLLAGERIDAPTTTVDLFRTTLAALGIDVPDEGGAEDLIALASRGTAPISRPLEATLPGRYATRWADLRLVGRDREPPSIFDLDPDPNGDHTKDLAAAMPATLDALFRWTWDHEALARREGRPRAPREPATIDPDTAAALAVWGR